MVTTPQLHQTDSWRRQLQHYTTTSFKVLLAAAVLIGPPIYLAYRPQDFTPLVQTLLSVFLFLLAFWIGRDLDFEKAKQEASDRWLPQAEAVTYRLLTLFGNVRTFADKMKRSCGETSCELPELQKDEMKSVRIKLKADCDAAHARLDDIAYQLADAIGDWQRFIAANCRGEQCARIFEAINERWQRVMMLAQQAEKEKHEAAK